MGIARPYVMLSAAALVGAGTLAAVPMQAANAAVAPTTCNTGVDRFFDVNKPPLAATAEQGLDDIALGTPMEDVKGHKDAGTVTIAYGDSSGTFGTSNGRSISMEDLGYSLQDGDRFGAAVLVADLNGDYCGDLVVGLPGRNNGAGIVVIAYGAPRGRPQIGDGGVSQVLKPGTGGVPGSWKAGDGFGSSLAVTGTNAKGGPTRLWVGSPGKDVGSAKDAGQVTVFSVDVTKTILPTTGVVTKQQGKGGVSSKPESGDRFGFSLAGTHDTMLVGSPGEDVGSVKDAGMFHAFVHGASAGFTAGTGGAPGTSEAGDQLGRSLAVGPSCKSGKEAWLVGAPLENVGTKTDAGQILLMDRGTKTGLALNQGATMGGTAASGDRFGTSLNATGTVNRSRAVFAVGAPYENVAASVDAGQVTTFATTCPGDKLAVVDATTWQRGSGGISGAPTKADYFGRALGAALINVSGNQAYRLVVSIPGGDEPSVDGPLVNSGLVLVMPATASGFTGTGSTTFGQGPRGDDFPGVGEEDDAFGSSLDTAAAIPATAP